MKKRLHLLSLASLMMAGSFLEAQQPLPTKAQLAWHEQEFYLFLHFGPNTFTGKEWGHGNEAEDLFDPAELDCRQWCRVARAAGAMGLIITAKHHDGFCLWPSAYSTHTVRESKWRQGKGDVLKELSEACREYGLFFGVYISPWDRNHPDYGTPKYNDVFVGMLQELFQRYGPIRELWWDGANGEGPNGKRQEYDWKRYVQTVRRLSPETVIFSDVGPDIRWVGNESGFAGTTNWNYLDTAGFSPGAGGPPQDTLNTGNKYGKKWIPAECDVSIRPGWFYHPEEDDKVKAPEQLFDLYLKSVGRGANLLLNVPPDRRGLIPPGDSTSLVKFRQYRNGAFRNNLARKGRGVGMTGGATRRMRELNDGLRKTWVSIVLNRELSLGIDWKKPQRINCVVLREDLTNGQHCAKFRVQLLGKDGSPVRELAAATIGRKRILTFPETEAYSLRLWVDEQTGATAVYELEAYRLPGHLVQQ